MGKEKIIIDKKRNANDNSALNIIKEINDLNKSKIEVSPKKVKSSLTTSTRTNKFKQEKEKVPEKKIISPFPRKKSELSVLPYKSQSVMKMQFSTVLLKPTKALNNLCNVSKQSNELIPQKKLYYNYEGIKEENRSFSPSYKNKQFGSTIVFSGTSRNSRRKLKEKIPIYLYIIKKGNNSELIKKCMGHRTNWKESTEPEQYNFKWQHVSTGLDFDNMSEKATFKQGFNHMEFHSAISNKMNLFVNIMKFCEVKYKKRNIEMFKFIPFTIIMQYGGKAYTTQFDSFIEVFNNFKSYLVECDGSRTNPSISKSDKYGLMFKLGYECDRLGYKTNILVNSSYYTGKNMWLIKAIDLNRGRCIRIVSEIEEIRTIIKSFYDGIQKSFKKVEEEEKKPILIKIEGSPEKENLKKQKLKSIVDFRKYRTSRVLLQKYLESPLLYWGRKFDIRVWVLYSQKDTVFAFKQGHLKTSSLNYDANEMNTFIHLTNYSVQKYNQEFAKFEIGNEVSYADFQKSLDSEFGEGKVDVYNNIVKKIYKIIKLTFFSVKEKINAYSRKNCFEIFGYDFIIDKNLDVYLLEVNTNPGLEESSPLIGVFLPRMIDDALRITIDNIWETKYANAEEGVEYNSMFPVEGYTNSENMWELVTDFNDFNDTFSL